MVWNLLVAILISHQVIYPRHLKLCTVLLVTPDLSINTHAWASQTFFKSRSDEKRQNSFKHIRQVALSWSAFRARDEYNVYLDTRWIKDDQSTVVHSPSETVSAVAIALRTTAACAGIREQSRNDDVLTPAAATDSRPVSIPPRA
jgi:hypothetical protein